MENIFTATQQRRNDKAIAAAIAEHGDSLVPSMIDSLAESMSSKYVWQERRDTYRAQIVQELTAYGLNSGSMNSYSRQHEEREPRERCDANRTANAMASRAPALDVEVIECDRRGEVIAQDYTIATTDGAVIAQVEHHNVTDTVVADDPDDDTIAKLEDTLADANAEIERLQEKNIEIERELRQVQDELEERTAELKHEEEQHEALKKQYKAAADAMEAMAALQDCEVTYGTALQTTLYRVSMGLAIDSWDDEYVRKDIAEAMRLAEQYAVMIGEEVTGYIEPQHQA